MGLFDVFKKKDCEICGNEVGLLGYKKLKDGEICNACVKLLSPWFADRRESTVAQIKAQLAYREQNAEELKSFQPTKTIGDYYYMYVEEKDGVPYRFCVSLDKDYQKENADLILFADVEELEIEINNQENRQVSDEDPDDVTYSYSYLFIVHMKIKNNPYFESITFRLNNRTPEVDGARLSYEECETEEDRRLYEEIFPHFVTEYRQYKAMCDEIEAMCK